MADCRSCKKPLEDGVKFCPHCGAAQKAEPAIPNNAQTSFRNRKTSPLAWVFIISIAAFSIWVSIPRKDDPCGFDVGAFTFVQQITTAHLVAPSTAEFDSFNPDTIQTDRCGYFQIRTNVHSQNSFGAMVKTPVSAEVKYQGEGKWSVLSLRLAGKVVN